ncbi:MAG: hypothetical protein WCS37_04085 [Chloroflexota bacterium]
MSTNSFNKESESFRNFGNLCYQYRKNLKLTQPQLGELVGTTYRPIQAWENSESFPKPKNLKRLIEIFLTEGAFTVGRELAEAEELWEKSQQKVAFDKEWFLETQQKPLTFSPPELASQVPSPLPKPSDVESNSSSVGQVEKERESEGYFAVSLNLEQNLEKVYPVKNETPLTLPTLTASKVRFLKPRTLLLIGLTGVLFLTGLALLLVNFLSDTAPMVIKPAKNIIVGQTIAVNQVAFSPDGKYLASADGDSTLKLWELGADGLPTERMPKNLLGHTSYVYATSFSRDGKFLVSASDDQAIKLWEPRLDDELSLKPSKTITGTTKEMWCVVVSPSNKLLATAGANNTAVIWNIETGEIFKTLVGHSGKVWELAFSPDGQTLATASADSTIKLWDVQTGQELYTFKGHTDQANTLAFSPDGKILASGSWDRTIKLWKLDTHKELLTLSGHSARVNSIAFAPNGQVLISGGKDKLVKLWKVSTGEVLETLTGYDSEIYTVALHPNGKSLASGTELGEGAPQGTIKFWKLNLR